MNSDRFYEHPEITYALAWGYPKDEDTAPHCPWCGEECSYVYKDEYDEIVGCEECCHDTDILEEFDAWKVDECFPEEE